MRALSSAARERRALLRADAALRPVNGRAMQAPVFVEVSAPESGDCAICYDCAEGKVWAEARCQHAFHRACIGKWRASGRSTSATCPLCRAPFSG
jgi:hypothetical protein